MRHRNLLIALLLAVPAAAADLVESASEELVRKAAANPRASTEEREKWARPLRDAAARRARAQATERRSGLLQVEHGDQTPADDSGEWSVPLPGSDSPVEEVRFERRPSPKPSRR